MARTLEELGAKFRELRQKQGHFAGGEHSSDVDNYDGEMHRVMQELQKELGKPGTPATRIMEYMGMPDEKQTTRPEGAPATEVQMMPGPVVPEGAGSTTATHGPPLYLLYKWRGWRDYLWFEVDSEREVVIQSDWYHAYE
ncbi:hypothetical protein SYNPS1DRAFT_11607 [Syncephalis pseudoplumigaleata]|uniref:Uncharacterized protein n=1 Tax=Syncephalis pseudoplumigaleata TaxID=1712513 RepID=A0A4P9Z8C6_9FUNG|nr:hypothetical protein SYNPS1DRAFT_11607 [Syncephalis pseudoplumigaleata]|eukprot:RKP28201.1 hypothetical protein SYNPS1DRAFT_11607 [Syncephalis pseudoplumigaleata]